MARNLKLYETNAEFLENETVSPSAITLEYNYTYTNYIYNPDTGGYDKIPMRYSDIISGDVRTVNGVTYYTDGSVLIDMEDLIAREILIQGSPQSISGWTFYPETKQTVARGDEAFPVFRVLNENNEELWVEEDSNDMSEMNHIVYSATTGTASGYTIVEEKYYPGLAIYSKATRYNEKPLTTSIYPGISLTEGNKVAYNPCGKIYITFRDSETTLKSINTVAFDDIFRAPYDYMQEHESSESLDLNVAMAYRGIHYQWHISGFSYKAQNTYAEYQEDCTEVFNSIKSKIDEIGKTDEPIYINEFIIQSPW